jgi:hypothetical protein
MIATPRQPTLTPANAKQVVRNYGGLVVEPVGSVDMGLALGIYAPGGIGKTTLAATITDSPLGSPALYLNARGNPHVIASYNDRIDVVNIEKFADVERVRQGILADKDCPYKSVILDNVSEMFYIDLRDLYGPAGDVVWEKHSATTADVLQLMRNWIDLTTHKGLLLNVVFVFQETPETRTIRGQEVKSRSEIGANKALQGQVPSIVNFLGRLYITSDVPPYTRMLDFSPMEKIHQGKIQVDRSHPTAGQIPYEIYNPSLASILDTIRGNQPWPREKHLKTTKQ